MLTSPDIPAALVELGYLSYVQDEKLLLSTEWRDKTADTVAKGIAGFFRDRLVQKVAQ